MRNRPPPQRRCTKCRNVTPPDGKSCTYCGADVPDVSGAESPERDLTHSLVTAAGEAFALEPGEVFVLGRSTGADLVARSTDVSRRHAQVVWTQDGAMLQDLDAKHGTFANGKRLSPHSVTPLQHGHRVRLASNTVFFYFHIEEDRLRAEIAAYGIGGLTSEFALKDIAERTGTRRWKRPPGLQRSEPSASPERAPKTVLPMRGTLDAIPGSQLLALLREKTFSGRLAFFDGVCRGQIDFVNGNPYELVMGRRKDQEVLEVFSNLRQGSFRLEGDVPRKGCLTRLHMDDLLCELHEGEATGILSLYRQGEPAVLTGRLVFIEGVACSAGFGKLGGNIALKEVGQLTEGRFVFEDKPREELDGRMQSAVGQRETLRLKRRDLDP